MAAVPVSHHNGAWVDLFWECPHCDVGALQRVYAPANDFNPQAWFLHCRPCMRTMRPVIVPSELNLITPTQPMPGIPKLPEGVDLGFAVSLRILRHVVFTSPAPGTPPLSSVNPNNGSLSPPKHKWPTAVQMLLNGVEPDIALQYML